MNKFLDNAKIIEAFNYRFATKKFNPNKVISTEDMDTILDAGVLSPSSFGIQPWKFVVITNPQVKEKLAKMATGLAEKGTQASHVVLFLSATNKAVDGDADNKGLFYSHFAKDLKLPIEQVNFIQELRKGWQAGFSPELNEEWTSKQTYIALGNMMTAAALLGIDSCPVEGFVKAEVNNFLQQDLNIDTSLWKASVICAFGYRDMDQPKKVRRAKLDLIHWVN